MHPTLMDLGLRRAGFPNLERYMEVCGLKTEEEAAESLMPYILGSTLSASGPSPLPIPSTRRSGCRWALIWWCPVRFLWCRRTRR